MSLIADGLSYNQLVDGHPGFTYRDVFDAAEEALRFDGDQSDCHERMAKIKFRYSRAYEKWTEDEKGRLTKLEVVVKRVTAIAAKLGRPTLGDPLPTGEGGISPCLQNN